MILNDGKRNLIFDCHPLRLKKLIENLHAFKEVLLDCHPQNFKKHIKKIKDLLLGADF